MDKEQFKGIKEKVVKKVPMGRMGGEQDLKGVAVFWGSPAA